MDISPADLKAFVEVVKTGSLTQAAKNLFVTQPAITLRLNQLETMLGAKVLDRGRGSVRPTDVGYQLLKYANVRQALEEEFLNNFLTPSDGKLRGQLQIAGHFSIINHVVIPALAPFLSENPDVMIRTIVKEDDELPPLLIKGEVDFMFLQQALDQPGFTSEFLGAEEYVMVEPTKTKVREGVYIDSDPSDVITEDFFKLQKNRPRQFVRSFLHNEAGILRGVLAGIGRGVVAKNEIPQGCPVRVLTKYRSLKIPSYLHYMEQPYFSKLQLAARAVLLKNCGKHLVGKS